MTMRRAFGARFLASAFLLCMAASAAPLSAAERLRLAAERADGGCPAATGPEAVLGIARLAADRTPPADASSCLLLVRVEALDDAALEAASQRLTATKGAAATIIAIPASEDAERFAYAVKRLASVARSASPDGRIGLDTPQRLEGDLAEQLSPYDDALVVRPGDPPRPDAEQRLWVLTGGGPGSAVDAVIAALARFPRAELAAVEAPEAPLDDAGVAALSRLQRYFTGDVSADPTETSVRRADGSAAAVVRYFDAKAFTPFLFLPNDPSGKVAIELSGGPYDRASVENLSSGARRDFPVAGARSLTLDASQGALAVTLHPASRGGSEARTAVDVGAIRGLTADEIIARERAWDAGQREKVPSYIAKVNTSLRFRIAELSDSLDLTILGPVLRRAGQAERLGVGGVLPQRREVEGPDDPEASDPAAREGHDASSRNPADRGVCLRARRGDHDRRAGRLPCRLPTPRGRRRQADLPWDRLDRQGDLRAAAARVDPAQHEGRHALERPDRVLSRRSRHGRRRFSRSRSAASRSSRPRAGRPRSSATSSCRTW